MKMNQGIAQTQQQAQVQKQKVIQTQQPFQGQLSVQRADVTQRIIPKIRPGPPPRIVEIKKPIVPFKISFRGAKAFMPVTPRAFRFVPQYFMKGGGMKLGVTAFKEKDIAQSFAARKSLQSKDIIGFKLVQAEAGRFRSAVQRVTPEDVRMLFNIERGGFIEKPSSISPSRLTSYKFAKFMQKKG